MATLDVLRSIVYYIFLPFVAAFNFLVLLLAPLLHIGSYSMSVFTLPLRFLNKFETLYIFFGVAAVIGLITGTVLHISSSVLVSLFNLQPSPEDQTPTSGRTAKSVRRAREEKRLEESWQTTMQERSQEARQRMEEVLNSSREYVGGHYSSDMGTKREGRGLSTQTILEEDDDSDDAY